MFKQTLAPRTPLTAKADRSDPRIRLLEEAILTLRGEWPGAATGLCMSVNSLYGFTLTGKDARGRMVSENAAEALRLVERLYGSDEVAEVRRRATSEHPGAGATPRSALPQRPAVGGRLRASRPAVKIHRGARFT